MVDYEWGNPSTIMLTGDEPNQESNQTRQIFDHYTNPNSFNDDNSNTNNYFSQPAGPNTTLFHHHQQQHNVHSLFDPRAYNSASAYAPAAHHHSMLSIDAVSAAAAAGGGGYFVIPKTEEVSRPTDFASRIGLNLGGRTYFSSADDDFVTRLYRRPRPGEPGSSNIPRCQAEGCNADLTHAKHYHRRHKVCEFHSKASTVIAAGLTQRFCQQCSRFHLLSEFDNGKRSCRKRLADHNRRRRKSQQQQQPAQDNQKSHQLESARNSPSENLAKSPPDSGTHSSSSVTVAVSPPRMSLDCFRQKPYQATASSSASSSSLFFSSG
ncbi:Squamosa promoter binding-like protein [Melia azedarach]|uniref:Squamosa promoter binding-like protein n=2 Tax=Melia azedarach TaxID=155640 RepID=A0ACC1YUQ7_MELAZ|nr:Squamosa promoter binding-like protein [Melia azedarach]KAJ4727212.1 Squamosa promoter binding-like protein [Melia azedarach]